MYLEPFSILVNIAPTTLLKWLSLASCLILFATALVVIIAVVDTYVKGLIVELSRQHDLIREGF